MRQRHAFALAMQFQGLGDQQRFIAELGLHHAGIAASGAAAFGRRAAGAVLAGQHAAGDRAVGHHADAEVGAGLQHLDLGQAVEQVVVGLADHRPRHVQLARPVHQLGDAPAAKVGHAPVADLAGAQQRVDRAQRLFQVHAVVVAVQVVDIDVVGGQPLQAGLAGPHHPGARIPPFVWPVRHLVADLGGQHPVVAGGADRLADHRLGGAVGVDIGGVDEVDTRAMGMVDDALGLGGIGLVTEHHRAQAQAGHFQRALAQVSVMHAVSRRTGNGERGTGNGNGEQETFGASGPGFTAP